MINRLVLFLSAGVFLFVSCVTTADLQDLADIHEQSIEGIKVAQVEYQAKVEEILMDASKTEAERFEDLKEAADARNDAIETIAKMAGTSVEQLIAVIEARTEAAVEGVGTVTGNPLIDLLVNTVLAAGLGAAGADRIRDRRRRLRGEPVGPAVPLTKDTA